MSRHCFPSKYFDKYSDTIKKILTPVSKIAMLALVIGLLVMAVPLIISKGILPILMFMAFIIVVLTVAHFMSLHEKATGPILPYSIVLRLPAPAIRLTQLNNTVEQHMTVIISYTILGTIVMMIYNKLFFDKKPV